MSINYFGKEKHFYNASIKRYAVLFGCIFNDLYIRRKNDTKDVLIKLPLKFGPGNAYENIPQDKESREQNKVRMVVPAMSFELQSFALDETRKENRNLKLSRSTMNVDGSVNTQFQRLRYNFTFVLSVLTKNLDDMLQVTEQILPVFNPNVTIKMKDVDNTVLDVEQDIKVFLVDVTMEDNWEMPEESRYIEYQFTFELRGYLYGRTVEVPTINEIEIRAMIENEVGIQQTISTIFDKQYKAAIEENSKHFQVIESALDINIDALNETTANVKQVKRTRKVNK